MVLKEAQTKKANSRGNKVPVKAGLSQVLMPVWVSAYSQCSGVQFLSDLRSTSHLQLVT